MSSGNRQISLAVVVAFLEFSCRKYFSMTMQLKHGLQYRWANQTICRTVIQTSFFTSFKSPRNFLPCGEYFFAVFT